MTETQLSTSGGSQFDKMGQKVSFFHLAQSFFSSLNWNLTHSMPLQ